MIVDPFYDKLLPGERIVWSGQPAQGIIFGPRDLVLIPFSIVWGGFAIFWESLVLSKGNVPMFFALWGVPFVLVGLFLIFGRFLADAYVRSRTAYAITDRRVLIARAKPFAAFTSLSLDQLAQVQLVEGPCGRSTIYFGPRPSFGRYGYGAWMPALDSTPQFLAVQNAQHVLGIISTRGSAGGSISSGDRIVDVVSTAPLSVGGVRIAVLIAGGLSIPAFLAYNTLFCVSSGGADVRVVRSYATTQANYSVADFTPVSRFTSNDTAMAIAVLTWPSTDRDGGWHRIVWNWYRDGKFVSDSRFCRMHFTTTPFTLRTWRAARAIGGGHVRVDTLIDGKIAASTEFDVAPQPNDQQGALPQPWFCG